MGVIGLDLRRTGRVTLMNQIGAALGIPPGGWHGQAKLFKGADIRLCDLLAMMARQPTARLIAGNLDRAGRYAGADVMMTLVVAQREGQRSLTATGTNPIDTYRQGGLDFLEKEKRQLGLPQTVTRNWVPIPHFINGESNDTVYPDSIPARDQMLAYAATIGFRFTHDFKVSVRAQFGDQTEPALARASRIALLVWRAYAFLAPGGNAYDPSKSLRDQLGQRFGQRSALGFYAHKAKEQGRAPALDDIVTDRSLDHLEWVRSAKTRAAETLFLERLLKRARELLSP